MVLDASVDFLAFMSLALLAVGAIVLAEWATAMRFLSAPASRKSVHLTVGLFVAIAVVTLQSPAWLMVAAAVAVAINILSLRRGWLVSIHPAESRSIGTVTFPLGLLLVVPFFWNAPPIDRYPLAIAFTVLAISDPVAAIVGSRFKNHRLLGVGPEGKTLAGSAAFGLAAWLVVGAWLTLIASAGNLPFESQWVWHMAAMVAIVAAASEMVGSKGWDNLFIIVSIVLVVVASDSDERVRFLGWCIVAAIVFSLLAYRLRFLSTDGAILSGLMGGSILLLGGWEWIVPPVVFFLSASLLSAWSGRLRGADGPRQERGSRRDAIQVLANGIAGWALVIVNDLAPVTDAYWVYAGAFAAAAADTFATEVGTALRGRTWSITSGQRVEPGTSGGVSLAGSAASVVGALIVALAAAGAVGEVEPGILLLVTGAGFLAAMVDSLFGVTLQASYRDAAGFITEAASTNGLSNVKVSGVRFVTNDTVNFLCTTAGAGLVSSGLLMLGY